MPPRREGTTLLPRLERMQPLRRVRLRLRRVHGRIVHPRLEHLMRLRLVVHLLRRACMGMRMMGDHGMMRVRPVRDLVRSQGGVCYAFFFNQYSIVRFFFFSFLFQVYCLYFII